MNLIRFPRRTLYPTILPSDIIDDLFKGLDTFADPFGIRLKGFPRGDLFVDDGKIIIELALAGYKKEHLSVRVDENSSIVISADAPEEECCSGRGIVKKNFTKRFPQLGKDWDVANAEVTFEDCVLRIVVSPLEPKEQLVKELPIK